MSKLINRGIFGLCAFVTLAIQDPAIAQQRERTLCDEMVNSVAEFCHNTWVASGYSDPQTCFNDTYAAYCPEQIGNQNEIGDRNFAFFWFPICMNTWLYWGCF